MSLQNKLTVAEGLFLLNRYCNPEKEELKKFRKIFRQNPNSDQLPSILGNLGALILLEPKMSFRELKALKNYWNNCASFSEDQSLFAWNNIKQVGDASLFTQLNAMVDYFESSFKAKRGSGYDSDFDSGDMFMDHYDI
jgi:hypothetical protein